MMRSEQSKSTGLWLWCAATLVLSVVVGVWNAENPRAQDLSSTPSQRASQETSQRQVKSTQLEQIESTLAQAGCPGWMTLASEGEAALQQSPSAKAQVSQVVPGDVRQTALRVARVPSVRYPAPVRVANRALFSPPASSNAQVSLGSSDDPDDLLNGIPDLLAAPVENTEGADASGAESQPATKAEQGEPKASPENNQPTENNSISTVPVMEPQAGEPVFPGSAPSPEESSLQADAQQPAKKTKVENLPQPAQEEVNSPRPNPELQQPDTSAASSPVPAFAPPPQLDGKPAKVRPSSSLPAPVRQSPLPSVPVQPSQELLAPVTPPAHTIPQQSPFTPPPTPAMPTPHSVGSGATSAGTGKPAGDKKSYCEFVAESQYPSAQACAKCHQQLFDEWSVSSHAYAAISPMFQKFEQKINDLSQGTIGYFCYRCHAPVGTNLGLSRATPLWDLPLVAREGVTCIACHRVNQRYGKVNGERRIEPGDIHAPVYGSIGGSGVAEVVANKNKYKVKTSPHEKGPGQDIHANGVYFDQLGKSEFCVSCHQVAVHPGIKLEVVWEQYRASPACKKGVSCQDCHMGRIPGVPSGYAVGAAAKINDKVINPGRKHANHIFYGPGYSIAHPGIFPHNIDANRWSMRDWLLFDWRAGWGTDEFEDLVDAGHIRVNFPPVWAEVDDRYDAREIIEDNQKKLKLKTISRQQVMENGSHVDGPYFDSQLVRGQDLKFHYIMTNTNEGHNLPSGSLGAQPQLWANVVLIGPRGQRLWESGYTDSHGDVADIHSEDVRHKRIPYDWQLFNLQTMFLITGAKGTDREFFLPVNIDIDQLPYLRPGAQPISVINHPPFIRMEGRSLAPLGSKEIPYKVPAHLLREPGHYRLSFRLRSRAEPIYFMRFCESTKEMNRAMNEGMIDFHQSSIEFFIR